jgi:hypothetical protein
MLASFLLMQGMTKKGLRVAEAVWERHERNGLRYNHIECGEHYYRAMSAWAMYLAYTGCAYDAGSAELSFSTRRGPGLFLFNTPSCWGRVQIPGKKGGELSLEVVRGSLQLSAVSLEPLKGVPAAVQVNGQPAGFTSALNGRTLKVAFDQMQHMKMGTALTAEFSGNG